MRNAPTILCEKSGRWATALRSALGKQTVVLTEARSLVQCAQALQTAPSALVAIEVTAATLEAMIEFLIRASRSYPAARIVALLDSELDSAQPPLREAGAVDVLLTIREAPVLARLAVRHAALAPRQELGLRETVAQRLPWQRFQTADFAAQVGISSQPLP